MKKIAKLIIAIFIIILFFELIAFIFKNNHNIEYTIKNKPNKFTVNEIYKNKKYYILITNKNYKYSFEIDNNFHKKKKILTKIIEYQTKDALCIYPVIKKSNETNIMCSKNKKSYSYTYYKDKLKDFVKNLQNKGYQNNSWSDENNYQIKVDTLKIYNKNINDNAYIYIYKYDGFYAINNETR